MAVVAVADQTVPANTFMTAGSVETLGIHAASAVVTSHTLVDICTHIDARLVNVRR